ncbi:MAG: aminotransferase class I/II-fold pyridoxal phosphate-dependent enzyme, partial [Candidatus Dormibacteraeota bacterium]|nr:aminotransferase class I/II-fold pyridoxal phosphate-dependent enzyme [Candidatus Dormibacteraeota bacterium]
SESRVIHIQSLTKSTAPSLRIGAVIARGPVAARLRALRLIDDFFVPRVLQEVAAEFLASSAWERHISVLAAALRTRRMEMVKALKKHAPGIDIFQPSPGGFYLWVRLPAGRSDVAVAEAAQRAGVMVSAGRQYHAAEPPAAFLRLSFVGTAHPGEMEDGITRLASVVDSMSSPARSAAT